MTSTPPPAHVAEMHENEIADAQHVCLAAEHDGKLLHIKPVYETDSSGGNVLRYWVRETTAQALHRCVQAQLDGDGEINEESK